MDNNKISDISKLDKLLNLQEIHLANNNISNINSIAKLLNLEELVLYNNKISDITPVEKLTKLFGLSLYNNKISDISSVAKLTNLKYLYLSNNNISNVSPLKNLSKLENLWLNDQKIYLESSNCKGSIEITNPIKDINSAPLTCLSNISNNGNYNLDTNTVKWNNLKASGDLSYSFAKTISIGKTTSDFTGKVYKNIKVL